MAARSARTGSAAPHWLTPDEQQVWIAFSHLVLQLPAALDSRLQRDAGVNLFEYRVLSRLSMVENWTLRMSELAEVAGGSLSRLSNVIKRLELRGFVRRELDSCNRRYTNAILTEPGWEKVVAAAPGHVAAVRDMVFDPLDPAQVAALGDIAARLFDHLRGECAVADEAADGVG